MANKLCRWCDCNSSVLCLHIFILGLVPHRLQPNHKLAERPRQLFVQSGRGNPLQSRLHIDRNSPIPLLHRILQMVHQRNMAKNLLNDYSSSWMPSSFRIDDDRRFLRGLWMATQSMIRSLLPTQPDSASPSWSISVHTSTLHKRSRILRIHRSGDQPVFPLRFQYTYSGMVHRFHSPRIRWTTSLQHDQTAAETGQAS